MKSARNRSNHVPVTVLLMVLLILVIPFTSAWASGKQSKINVMTRNLYLGADIFKIVEAAQEDPNQIPFAVAEVFKTMLFTNFRARAEAIADEIAENNPDMIGLQEVSTFYKQTPGDFLEGNPLPADGLVIDFYAVLEAALQARGLDYQAFSVSNADVELPMADLNSPTFLSDVRLVDRDMVLVRRKLPAAEVLSVNFQNNLGLNIGGAELEFTRGFLIVDVEIKSQPFRFANTHLEVRSEPGSPFRVFQAAQMQELLLTLEFFTGLDPKPVVMVGDFNSSPEDEPGVYVDPEAGSIPYVPPYMQAVESGYLDAWLLQKFHDEGYTSGFGEYISNPKDELTTRIDLIFIDPQDLEIRKIACDVVGDEVTDMVPNPIAPEVLRLWPSDHAGVVGKLKFLRP